MQLYRNQPVLTSHFDVSKLQKQLQNVIQISFGLVCQLWSVTPKCMRDSKPQPCFEQHKSLKVTQNATNRDKHINETSKQIFANNLFKVSSKYTQGMFPNWKICFNVINDRTYHELLGNLSKSNDTVIKTTCNNFPICCQQTTKTTSKCDTNSLGPVCQATNLFKISCRYTQSMLSNWKKCFNVINIPKYDKKICNLNKINETVK